MQMSQIDRRLFRSLAYSFDFIYLLVILIVHMVVGLYGIQFNNQPAINTITSYVGFLVIVCFIITIDATPAMMLRTKKALLLMLVLNSIRVYVFVYLTNIPSYPSFTISFVYQVNAHDLSVSTFTTIAIYILRYFIQLLRYPKRLMILAVEVLPVANTVRVDRTRQRESQINVLHYERNSRLSL